MIGFRSLVIMDEPDQLLHIAQLLRDRISGPSRLKPALLQFCAGPIQNSSCPVQMPGRPVT